MDLALFYAVDPDYLNVMRIPLLRGRFVTEQDNEKTPCAAAVDEDFVHRAFPNENPLGQHINFELLPMKCEIVGVVGHVKHWGLDTDATAKVRSQLYLSARQLPDAVMDLASTNSDWVVRTTTDPYAVLPALKQTVSRVSGSMVMFSAQTMRDVISNWLSARRFTRLLLGSFAILALVLAAVGIYGVVSYTVTQATQEIGVRMALGADGATALRAVLKSAMTMAVSGIVVGAMSAFAATRRWASWYSSSCTNGIRRSSASSCPAVQATNSGDLFRHSWPSRRRSARMHRRE